MENGGQINDREQDASEIAHQIRTRASQKFKIEYVLKIYSAIGFLVALGGSVYFILTTLHVEISQRQQVSLIAVGSGITVSLISWLTTAFMNNRESYEIEKFSEYSKSLELVNSWANFEMVGRNLLELEGDDFNKYSLRSMISHLKQEAKISDFDQRVLQDALELRNMIVHARGRFPTTAVVLATNKLNAVIDKLSSEAAKLPHNRPIPGG